MKKFSPPFMAIDHSRRALVAKGAIPVGPSGIRFHFQVDVHPKMKSVKIGCCR